MESLSDKFYLEIIVNGGRKVLSTNIYPDEEANLLSMFAMDGKCIFNNVIIWDLSGVNKEERKPVKQPQLKIKVRCDLILHVNLMNPILLCRIID